LAGVEGLPSPISTEVERVAQAIRDGVDLVPNPPRERPGASASAVLRAAPTAQG